MITAKEVKAIRMLLKLTQYEFALVLSFGSSTVPERTVQKWEQGVRTPSSAAESLLYLIKQLITNECITLKNLLLKTGRQREVKAYKSKK